MSGINRGVRTADLGGFGVLAAIVICCIIVGLLGYLQGQQTERDKQTSKTYAEAAQKDAQRACIGMQPGAAFECIYEKVESSNEQANADKDLTAQFRAADSALLSAVFAFLTLAISGLGVWYVKRTLDATLKAVEDTSEATEAMREANKIAREAMLDNGRPWLFVEPMSHNAHHWRNGRDLFEWKFNVVNHGQSLAIVDHVEAGVCFSDVFPRNYRAYYPGTVNGFEIMLIRQELNIQVKHSSPRILRPTEVIELSENSGPVMRMDNVPPELRKTREHLQVWTSPAGPDWLGFWLAGKVRYRDARNRRLETGFCYRLSFKGPTAITEEGGDQYNYRT